MQTDKSKDVGNESVKQSFDNFPINTNTVSTPIVKEKGRRKTGRICCANETKMQKLHRRNKKNPQNEVVEEVINPVTPEPEEVKIPEPVKKVEESSGEDVDVEDKDSTEPILDKDTLAKAMNFMAGM